MEGALPRLRIVTGKGGVGKTVVATAIAIAQAKRGRRTLLAEVHGRDRVTALLGAEPVGAEIREVLENLYVVDMNKTAAIREYVLLTLRFEAVYKAVFENRTVQRFLRLVPSLGELVMLGKVWFHEQEVDGDRPRFDVIVLDAPATGHALALLRAPSVVLRMVPPGPLRDNTAVIQDLLTDHRRCVLHVVTTPEEMPVNEAVELEQGAADILNVRLGETVINQRLEPLSADALATLAGAPIDEELRPLLDALRIREGKCRDGEEHLERLPAHMLANSISLPRLVDPEFGREAVTRLAEIIGPALQGETAS
ncbi:MAG: ArsA-related P-loop ATPase [Myxococcota bacterium]